MDPGVDCAAAGTAGEIGAGVGCACAPADARQSTAAQIAVAAYAEPLVDRSTASKVPAFPAIGQSRRSALVRS
jgi:hypothetical protein